MMAKKCIKKRDARAELLFCQSALNEFLTFSLPLQSCEQQNSDSS